MDGKSKLFPDEGFTGDVVLGSGYSYRSLCCNEPGNWVYDVRVDGAMLWDAGNHPAEGNGQKAKLLK